MKTGFQMYEDEFLERVKQVQKSMENVTGEQ